MIAEPVTGTTFSEKIQNKIAELSEQKKSRITINRLFVEAKIDIRMFYRWRDGFSHPSHDSVVKINKAFSFLTSLD